MKLFVSQMFAIVFLALMVESSRAKLNRNGAQPTVSGKSDQTQIIMLFLVVVTQDKRL